MAPKIDTPLHLRPMLAPEPEMVADEDIQYVQLHDEKGNELDEYVHWDPETSKMVKGGKPKARRRHATGGMIARDRLCKDCGAHLQAGRRWPTPKSQGVYYLICGRIAHFDPNGIMPEPTKDSVMECGNYEPPEPRPVEA